MRKIYTNILAQWSRLFYFIPTLIFVFSGCIPEDPEKMQEPLPDFDVKHWASGLKPFEFKDPVFKNPDYDSLFTPDFSVEALEAMWDEGKQEITPLSAATWQVIKEKAGQAGPGMAEILANMDLNSLMEIIDREHPLDPVLEELLVSLFESEGLGLQLPEIPEIELNGEIALDREMSRKPQKEASLRVAGILEFDESCEGMVYYYADGMRKANSEFREEGLEAIFADFLDSYEKADMRFQQRNRLIHQLYDERLTLARALIEKALRLAQQAGNIDTCEIRDQLNHLSVLYAYYIRKHFDGWYITALNLNRYYYEKELEQIDALRSEREAELEEIFEERGQAIALWEDNALKQCKDTGTFTLPEIP